MKFVKTHPVSTSIVAFDDDDVVVAFDDNSSTLSLFFDFVLAVIADADAVTIGNCPNITMVHNIITIHNSTNLILLVIFFSCLVLFHKKLPI